MKLHININKGNKNFIKECEKRRFAVRYMIRDINNIDYNFIDKYKKIIFINKLKFTPFEKELLEIVGNQIQLMYSFDINASVIISELYEVVKAFYKEMISKQTEKIVLKKT